MTPIKFIFASILFASSTAFSQVQIGKVSSSGTGCPEGTVTAVTSPDATTLSVLFDAFSVESQNGVLERKVCDLTFMVNVAPKTQIQFITADYRGAEYLSEAARSDIASTINASYRFQTPKGVKEGNAIRPVIFSHWNEGPFEGPIFLSQQTDFPTWTPCGKPIKVTAQIAASVRSPMDTSLVVIDSADFVAGARQSLSLGYAVRVCK